VATTANARATSRGELIRLDITDGSIDQRVPVDGVAVVGMVNDTLWVQSGLLPEQLVDTTDQDDEVIAALDVTTGEYRWVTAVDRNPVGMVVIGDLVWLALQQPTRRQHVLALDITTGEVVIDALLPEGASMLDDGNRMMVAAEDGTLWLLVGTDNTVFRIDTATGEAVEQFRFSVRPTTFAVTDDAVLALSPYDDAVARVARSDFEPVPADE